MSKTDRDRLVAGRENRGFSYTEESDHGEEGGIVPYYVNDSLSGEHISVCLKGVFILAYFGGIARRAAAPLSLWHLLNGG